MMLCFSADLSVSQGKSSGNQENSDAKVILFFFLCLCVDQLKKATGKPLHELLIYKCYCIVQLAENLISLFIQ